MIRKTAIAVMEASMHTILFYLGLGAFASLPFVYEQIIERIRRE